MDLEKFKAINEADGSNTSCPWVEAIVRLQRRGLMRPPAIALAKLGRSFTIWF
jgi:hypothetical protein